jgi:hypothetical protein
MGGVAMGGSNADHGCTLQLLQQKPWQRQVVVAWCFVESTTKVCRQLVNSINMMLGNYGIPSTSPVNHTYFNQGDDAAVAQLVKDMNAGTVGAVLIAGVNPAYSLAERC